MNSSANSQPASAEDAVYYHNDIYGSKILVGLLESYLGERVLEVGAGTGFITQELAGVTKKVVAIEPNRALFNELIERTHHLSNVSVLNTTLEEFIRDQRVKPDGVERFDSAVYINVLEHIERDREELSLAKQVLSETGHVLIVVPAHQWLYSKVDQLSGHFRRYSKAGIASLLGEAGLRPKTIQYFDSVGLLPYLIMYKWFCSTAVAGANAAIYSRVILPAARVLHRLSRGRLIGKNLVVVAELDGEPLRRP